MKNVEKQANGWVGGRGETPLAPAAEDAEVKAEVRRQKDEFEAEQKAGGNGEIGQ